MSRPYVAMVLTLAACQQPDDSNGRASTREGVPNQATERSATNTMNFRSPASNAPDAETGAAEVSAPRATPRLTRAYLVGRWTNPGIGTCGPGDAGVEFRADGSFVTSEGDGRWRLDGRILHMTNWGGAPAQLELRANGDLGVTWDYGSEVWRRCP